MMAMTEDKFKKENQDRDAVALLLGGQRDPIGFMTSCLDVKPNHVWSKMRDVAEAVRDYPRVAVKAGHSVSKSYTAARLALWFLVCHPPATVVTTAPTHKQVEDILWREIAASHAEAKVPIGGTLTTTNLDLGPKWFATGFSTRPDTVTKQATAFQGYHNTHVLVILDEAAGIMPQIWEAADSLLSSGYCRLLAIGNPTSPYGRFPDCFREGSGYKCITISVLDTPNYQEDRDVIPGLAGRRFVEQAKRVYGEQSNYFRSRVLGEIPDYTEGSIFGKIILALRERGRIGTVSHDPAALVHTAWDLGMGDATAIWFFQILGAGEVHVIDYIEGSGDGLVHWAAAMDHKRRENGWLYGEHFAPHDIQQRELSTGNTRLDTARSLGIEFTVLPREGLEDGIEAARQTLDRCWFDSVRCREGLKSLSEYHWRKLESVSTDEKPVYSRNPEHDWSSHGADAFRYLSAAVRGGMVSAIQPGAGKTGYTEWANYYGQAS